MGAVEGFVAHDPCQLDATPSRSDDDIGPGMPTEAGVEVLAKLGIDPNDLLGGLGGGLGNKLGL